MTKSQNSSIFATVTHCFRLVGPYSLSFLQSKLLFQLMLQLTMLVACLTSLTIKSNAQAEQCNAALGNLRNEQFSKQTNIGSESYKRDFYRMTEDEAYDEYLRIIGEIRNNRIRGGGNTILKGLPVGGSGSFDNENVLNRQDFVKRLRKWKDTVSDKVASESSYESSNYYRASSISPEAIKAWENCMTGTMEGLFAYAYRDGKDTWARVVYHPSVILPVELSFLPPNGIEIPFQNSEDKTIPLGEYSYKIATNTEQGFSVVVNGKVRDAQGKVLRTYSPNPVKVGPATLATLPVIDLSVTRVRVNFDQHRDWALVQFPITLAEGDEIESIKVSLVNARGETVKSERLPATQRQAGFRFEWIYDQGEHGVTYPSNCAGTHNGIVYVPNAQFKVEISFKDGESLIVISKEKLTVDRR